MIIVAVIFALIMVLSFGLHSQRRDEWSDGWQVTGFLFAFLALASLLLATNFRVSTQSLTGYIYSSEERVGYITGHIRFSENAGTDVQPSFCVASNSEAGEQIKKYVGSGKKVKINIPPYFYLANNPFACGTTKMTVVEVN